MLLPRPAPYFSPTCPAANLLMCVFCMHASTGNNNNNNTERPLQRRRRLHKALQLTLAAAQPSSNRSGNHWHWLNFHGLSGTLALPGTHWHSLARPGELFILCVEFLGHTNWKYAAMHAPHYVYAMWDRLTSAIIHNNNGGAHTECLCVCLSVYVSVCVLLLKNNKQHWLQYSLLPLSGFSPTVSLGFLMPGTRKCTWLLFHRAAINYSHCSAGRS